MSKVSAKFGEIVLAFLKRNGLTFRAAAFKSGISAAYWKDMSDGRVPSEDVVTPASVSAAAGAPLTDAKVVRFGISQRYTETRGVASSISHWISFNVAFSLSKSWSISYSQNYNIRGKETTDKSIEIHRDLHCWEGRFTWNPEGSREGFYFRLNVKLMPEVKLEKSESSIRDALFRMIPSE